MSSTTTLPAQPDRAALVRDLRSSGDVFTGAVAGLSAEQFRFKPACDRWNIRQIVEHVAVTEHVLYVLVSKVYLAENLPTVEGSAASLARASDRKEFPLFAPERVMPKGRFVDARRALEKFLENRRRTIEFVESCPEDLRLRRINHATGAMNGLDFVKLMIHHPLRHAEQIEELKRHSAFPGGSAS